MAGEGRNTPPILQKTTWNIPLYFHFIKGVFCTVLLRETQPTSYYYFFNLSPKTVPSITDSSLSPWGSFTPSYRVLWYPCIPTPNILMFNKRKVVLVSMAWKAGWDEVCLLEHIRGFSFSFLISYLSPQSSYQPKVTVLSPRGILVSAAMKDYTYAFSYSQIVL